MSELAKKRKTVYGLIILFFVFFVPTTNSFGQTITPAPIPPLAVPTGLPASGGLPVMDVATQFNTNLLITNTYSIASILAGTQPGYAQNDTIMVRLGKLALKQILRNVTQSIVSWIDSGFEGNPSFITDTGQFLQDTADQTIGAFLLNDPALNFLCDPFKIQVKLSLGFTYRPFKEKIQCSFTSAIGNIDDAYNNFVNGDFIAGGGWNNWLKLTTEPQNNQMGAMLIAQGELDARLEGSTHQAELEANWGQGFLSWKDCPVPQPGDPNFVGPVQPASTTVRDPSVIVDYHRTSAGCTIKTPGTAIASKIEWADSSTIRQLEISNDIDAIFNALFNQVLHLGMEIMTDNGLLGSGSKQPDTSYEDYMTYLEQQQALLANQYTSSNSTGNNASNNGGTNSNNPDLQNIEFSDPYYSSPTAALDLVNSLLQTQNQFLINQNNIYILLDGAQKSFESALNSTGCGETDKQSIKNDVDQITGAITYDKTLSYNLFWNKKDVALATTTTATNIATLNSASVAISAATSEAEVSSIIQNTVAPLPQVSLSETYVNSFSESGTNTSVIKGWINQVKNADYSQTCIIP